MSREWKPGDVAVVEESGMPTLGIRTNVGAERGWLIPQARVNDYRWLSDITGNVRPIRPLVVIDPEDRDEVARLVNLYEDRRPGNTRLLDHMTTALREFANPTPPKPAEPTGLGAVVEDDEHRQWVRHDNTPGSFPWVRAGFGVAGWSEIEAVRVLSEGVTL